MSTLPDPLSGKSRLTVLLEHFATIDDPRDVRRIACPLAEILLLVVCGTIADCDDYDHIAAWGETHLEFLWHGFLSTGYAWREVAPLLADAGLAVLIPDKRSFGDSDKPEGIAGYDARALVLQLRFTSSVVGFSRTELMALSPSGRRQDERRAQRRS